MVRWVVVLATLGLLRTATGSLQPEPPTSWSLPSSFDSTVPLNKRDFYYRMKGMIRLLIFWIGRDEVGGGRISFLEPRSVEGTEWFSGVEVLFGSRSERVPGRNNRRGCAREFAYWRAPGETGLAVLERTVFEGFMSKSSEESLDEVRKSEGGRAGAEEVLYEGAVSSVERSHATGKLWHFWSAEKADYRNPQRVGEEYVAQLTSRKPDVKRELENRRKAYAAPFGFLSAAQAFVTEALSAVETSGSLSRLEKTTRSYVHNARLYTLKLDEIQLHPHFQLSRGEEFQRVLRLDMKTEKKEDGKTHSFTIYVATCGSLRGVPLRIVDKPRWWLKVQLELDQSPDGREGSRGNLRPTLRHSSTPTSFGQALQPCVDPARTRLRMK